ncbi:MAG: bifunctional serine/threonine-protein kinase/formylglycine-generating enzyme family protein [Candidatus Promineifilaceae bacterium]|nr:bifunctional serine/threonine-protein kinase/formylglycine-generating enzyme family protein [Candidatus Promineifilaceae bacterium]
MPLLPGEILQKRYRIASLLGRGSTGAVYRAWDRSEGRGVAVKEYLDPSDEARRLFRREAERWMRLQHQQLPKVHDYFSLPDIGQYLVAEYIDGVSLAELLAQYGPLPADLVIDWLQAVAKPLDALHEQGLVHLDIKPANIRVRPDGRVFVVDTGLAGLGANLEGGSFAPPERARAEAVGAASDIYQLGATLYVLLTGQEPTPALERESGLQLLTPAREVNDDVPPYLSVAANRAMDLRPAVRFASAQAFAEALAAPPARVAAPSSPASPAAPRRTAEGPFSAPVRPVSRRKQIEQRTIYALLALLLIALGVGAGLSLASRRPAVQEAQAAATATLQSQVIAALTAITTPSPTPAPSATPIPTPAPLVDEATGARMIYVPGGIFRMGNDEGDPDEAPAHIVRLDPYFIDEYEVTNGQYAQCVEAGDCQPPDRPGATYHPAYYGDPAYADYPVIFVNWYDGLAFCNWRGARLPSEAEWERAAGFDPGQGIRYRYPWGDTFDGSQLNYCDSGCPRAERDNEYEDGHQDTAAVGSFPEGRSPLGLYDMAGNVMEWVGDWYDPRYYQVSPDTNPLGPLEGEFKTLRGGSWLSTRDEVRVTGRSSYQPSVSRANLGFRCAMTAP